MIGIVVFFLVGVWLAVLQAALPGISPFVPQVLPVFASVLLLRAPVRTLPARAIPLMAGYSCLSLEPLGVFLLAVGIAAVVLQPMRELLYVNRWPVQLVACGLTAAAFVLARLAGRWLQGMSLGEILPGEGISPLMTAVLVPILHLLWEGLHRLWPALRLLAEPNRRVFL